MAHDSQPMGPIPTALLLKLRKSGNGLSLVGQSLAQSGEVLFDTSDTAQDMSLNDGRNAQWVRINASDNPWDQVHSMMRMGFAIGSGDLISAEPDFEQQWIGGGSAPKCFAEQQDAGGGRVPGPHNHWHLDAPYSGLANARANVSERDQSGVLVAHLDTGYDPDHKSKPAHIAEGERNFIKKDARPNDARDTTPPGGFLRNLGHGTGTAGILAGPVIGGAPSVAVLPIRIADGVVRFTTSTMAQGFRYALERKADVLSMSMGGLASGILADAVNLCYAGGMVMVAAAGNNYSGLPVRSIVYPARMRRVIAACGIMANLKAYAGLDPGTMEGCYGPNSKMLTAVSGFTPNIPWAEIGCPDIIDEDGQGTSAATPQIAAAVALWIARYRQQLDALPIPWQRGEAARHALFASAALGNRAKPDPKLGWGAVKANALLSLAPANVSDLKQAPEATASWAWVKLLTGKGVGFANSGLRAADDLLALELAQLAQRDSAVGLQIKDPDAAVSSSERRRFLEAAEASDLSSKILKRAIQASLATKALTKLPAPPEMEPASASSVQISSIPAPPRRRLRIFALDPSLGGSLNSYEDQVATIEVRNEADLSPGPVGEYLEVVDVDPASDRFYPPVDLNDPNLLLQDGLTPSEGDPRFHQQMVYAVAMRTIENFELALGRKALWAAKWTGQTGAPDRFVKRLRIYPHALRQENAYYSPDKKALLFGYFPANSKVSDLTPPGTMVFGCLSADIIAHETTHALLDGQARTFREPSNPDVRAFHEAFSDMVALFQQFTYHDLVHREIARARGDLSAAGLLGGLARQFGEGTGKSGPLRHYPNIDPEINYETTYSTHDRGSLLVSAVYRAFLAIVERRTSDLLRLATGGSGVLPEGAIHPDLVERLTNETTRAAKHVLRICIRAIDYCPPVDITFGEYLRALITADLQEMPNDRFGYRTAFLEAFRRLQLLPRSLRTVSVETLRWNPWTAPTPDWLANAIQSLGIDYTANLSREQAFDQGESIRQALRGAMQKGLRSQADCNLVGLQYRLPYFSSLSAPGHETGTTFKIENLRVARRVREDGDFKVEIVAVIRQSRPELLHEANPSDPEAERFWFRGGATLIIDPLASGGPKIRFVIRKPIVSPDRLARERAYRRGDLGDPLRSMYFSSNEGGKGFGQREPFAIIHSSRN